jgi:hypothetical protein
VRGWSDRGNTYDAALQERPNATDNPATAHPKKPVPTEAG